MSEADILVFAAEAIFKADSLVLNQVARITEALGVLEGMARDESSPGRALCAGMALAVVNRNAGQACDRHFEGCMDSIRRSVGKEPEQKQEGCCQFVYSGTKKNCGHVPNSNDTLCHNHRTVVDQEIREGKRNTAGRTPTEEYEARIKNGCCGECGSNDGHFHGCSQHPGEKP